MGPVPQYRWNDVEKEQLNPLFMRQVIHGEKITVARIRLGKGCIVPQHAHVNEQITMLHEGKLRFLLEGRELILEAGEVLHIPANAPHEVHALEDSVAVDVFSPTREDWRTGNDAYLRR